MSPYTSPVFLANGGLDHSLNEHNSLKEGNNEAPEGEDVRNLGLCIHLRKKMARSSSKLCRSVWAFALFLAVQEDLLRLFMVTECATGNALQGVSEEGPMGSQKCNTGSSRVMASNRGQCGLSPEHRTSPGRGLLKMKCIYRYALGARTCNCSLLGRIPRPAWDSLDRVIGLS